MLSPWSVNKNNNHHESTPQKILKEKLNRRALAESGNRLGFNFDHELRNGDLENPVGADIRPPPSRPDSEGRLRSAYDRVKEMENGISTGTGYGIKAGGDSALPNLRNGALSRSADVGNLLRQGKWCFTLFFNTGEIHRIFCLVGFGGKVSEQRFD